MNNSRRENIVAGNFWIRALHMLILIIAYQIAELAMALTTLYQFFSAMITGRVNEPLLTFSKNAAVYVRDIWDFLTFNTEQRPFPFTDWPDEVHTGEEWLVEDEFDSADNQISSETREPDTTDPVEETKQD